MRLQLRTTTIACFAALVVTGCSSAPSSTSGDAPNGSATSLADLATRQRSCIDALKVHLHDLPGKRLDGFLAQTLNGVVVCDSSYGLAHVPTREISTWLESADGKPHPHVRVPDQPAEIATLPHDGPASLRYQSRCIAWMRRYLPASIAHRGDDPDTAAADVFNGFEECDAAAGFATISSTELAHMVSSKNLE